MAATNAMESDTGNPSGFTVPVDNASNAPPKPAEVALDDESNDLGACDPDADERSCDLVITYRAERSAIPAADEVGQDDQRDHRGTVLRSRRSTPEGRSPCPRTMAAPVG